MKSKKLMLVALLITCLLTMSAVNASEDNNNTLASDTNGDTTTATHETINNGDGDNDNSKNINENENQYKISEDDPPEPDDDEGDTDAEIEVDDEINRKHPDNHFSEVKVKEKKGNFTISKGKNEDFILYKKDLSELEDDDTEEDGFYHFKISLNELNSYIETNIEGIDDLYKMKDKQISSDDVLNFILRYDENTTINYKYFIYFLEDDEDQQDPDRISLEEVKDRTLEIWDIEDPNEPFIKILVKENIGNFTIYKNQGNEKLILYYFDLSECIEDEFGLYNLDIYLENLTNYIQKNIDGANSFDDLVSNGNISNDDVINFVLEYSADEEAIFEKRIIRFEDDVILFDGFREFDSWYDDEFGLEVLQDDDDTLFEFRVSKEDFDTDTNLIIYLNKDYENAILNTTFSKLTPISENDYFYYYNINISDLKIADVGEYTIDAMILDDEGGEWITGDEDEKAPLILKIFERQTAESGNSSIEIIPLQTVINEKNNIIKIKAPDEITTVLVYINSTETPVTISLADCKKDGDYYLINPKQVINREGKYSIKVCLGDSDDAFNLTGNVNLVSNLQLSLPSDDEPVYTGFEHEDNIIGIGLLDGDIENADVNGTITVLIYLDDENPTLCFTGNVSDLRYHGGPRCKVISYNELELDNNLNGSYKVVVKYSNGNEADVEIESYVNFDILDADDFEFTINEDISDYEDNVVTFDEIPKIDGNYIIKCDGDIIFESNYWELRDNPNIPTYELEIDENGDYNITLIFKIDDFELELANRTIHVNIIKKPEIFIEYTGENGEVQYTNTSDNMIHIYPNEDPTNHENIRIVVIINNTEYLNATIGELQLEEQINDEDEIFYTIGPKHFNQAIPLGHYENIIVYYISDNYPNIELNEWYPNYADIVEATPEIFLMYTGDWDSKKSQYTIYSDDLIHIYPNGDDVSSIRIIVKIRDETYLNSTIEELNLEEKINDEGNHYFTIGLVHLNKTFSLGEHYDNVVAYYYSAKHELNTTDSYDNPDFFDVIGIIEEIDVAYNDPVLFIIGDNDNNRKIILNIYNKSNNQWLPSIEYPVSGKEDNQFINWTLSQLGLGVGDYRIEAKYSDDYWIFDSDFSVVDKSNFFVKVDCDWLYTAEYVIKVWCPTDGEGSIKISVNDGEPIEHVIIDGEKGTYIGFTLSDLGITESNWYNINVTVNGQQITDENAGLGIPSPIEIPNTNVYLLEEGYNNDFSTRIARLKLTNNTSGNVVITIDGIEYFNENLENIPCYMDKSKLVYEIFISDLNSIIDVGTYNVEVTFNNLKVSNVINFLERNSKSQDGISIIILNGDKIRDWDDIIAEIIAPNNANGRVVVTLNGNKVANWDELGWIGWDNYDNNNRIHYIHTYDLDYTNAPEFGKYNINVSYYINNENFISNNDTILLMGDSANQVGIWFKPGNMLINSTEDWIHLYPNGNDGRFVLTINGIEYFNKTTDKLNHNDERNYISTSELNPSIEVGHYDNIQVTFYSNNDYSYKTWKSQATLKGYPNFNINIENGKVDLPIIINVTANEKFNDYLDVIIGDIHASVQIINGKGINDTIILPANTGYVASVNFGGNDLFLSESADSDPFDIDKLDSPITINIPKNEYTTLEEITISITNITTVNATINDQPYTINPDGTIKIQATTLGNGTHTITVYNNEDNTYKANTTTQTFTINKINPQITADVNNIEKGSDAIIRINTNNAYTGNITLQINNNNYTVEIKQGTGSKTISNLNTGTYKVKAIFNETNIFKASEYATTFNVTEKTSSEDGTSNDTTPPTTNPSTPPSSTPSTPTRTTTNKVTLTKTKIVKTISKQAKKLVISTILKINGKTIKGKKVIFIVKNKKFTAKTDKKGRAKLTIKKKALQKILKKVKAGKKIKLQIKYGKKTVTRYIKVKK